MSAPVHPFPSCIDCKIYKGLCSVHAAQLGRKAGLQTEPFCTPAKSGSSTPSSPTTESTPILIIPDKDESKIRDESANCMDCKIFKTMCGVHLAKIRALSLQMSPQGARSPVRSPGGFYKSPSSVQKNPLKRTTSFTGLSNMRKSPLAVSASLDASSFPSPTKGSDSQFPSLNHSTSSSSTSSMSTPLKNPTSQESLPTVKELQRSTPLIHEDGPDTCPNCHHTRDIDNAVFCGDCGFNYQAYVETRRLSHSLTGKMNKNKDTSSVPTTISISTNSLATLAAAVCKDCRAERNPPDAPFCGDCGYRFPTLATGTEDEIQAF